jgi:hypothetical protein
MKRLTILCVIGIPALLAATWFSATEDSLQLAIRLHTGLTATVSFDVISDGSTIQQTQEGDASIFSNSTYRIALSESTAGARSILRLRIARQDGESFNLRGFAFRVRIPSQELKGVWYPSASSSSKDVMAGDGFTSLRGIADANQGVPYIAASSIDGQNIFAMGLANQGLAVEIEADPLDAARIQLGLYCRTRRTAQVFEESFYISNDASVNWFDTAAEYAAWADGMNGYRPMPISARAYEPLYDVWYYTSDNVDEATYLSAARLAKEMGLGSFLADSGWDAPAGEYGRWLHGKTGDYDPPLDRFRNLKETFDQIRSVHRLNVQLWLQPFAVGRESRRYAPTRDLHIHVPSNAVIPGWPGFSGAPFFLPVTDDTLENVNLCPRLTATQTYLQQLIREVSNKYKPDGYWLDFIDGMPSFCVAPHKHDVESFGEGLRLSLEAVRNAIQSTTPGAVVQYRANYANLHNKAFANVWQPEDSPGDFDRMRLKALRMRPFSRGVVFASDQLYWRPDLDDIEASQFVMTAIMIGVPAFGPDLTQMRESQREIIRSWMRFYRWFYVDLNQGRFQPFGRLPMPNHKIESSYRTFVYLRNLDFPIVEAEAGIIYLLNATDSDSISTRVRVTGSNLEYSLMTTNRFLQVDSVPTQVTSTKEGILDIEAVVERGGMAILVRALN